MLSFGTKITSSSQDFNLEDISEEEIILSVRKHFITYIYDVLIHVIILILFFILFVFLHKYFYGFLIEITEYASIVFLFIIWSGLFYFITLQYFDVWFVAKGHMVAINQKEVFSREVAILRLDKIQDISYKKEGLLSNIFNYGDIIVQTASVEQMFTMKCVGKVEDVAHELMRLRDEYHQVKNSVNV